MSFWEVCVCGRPKATWTVAALDVFGGNPVFLACPLLGLDESRAHGGDRAGRAHERGEGNAQGAWFSPAGLLPSEPTAPQAPDPGPGSGPLWAAGTATQHGICRRPSPSPSTHSCYIGRGAGSCPPSVHPILSAFRGLSLQLSPDSPGLVDAVAWQPGVPPSPCTAGAGLPLGREGHRQSQDPGAWRAPTSDGRNPCSRPGEVTASFSSPGALSFLSGSPKRTLLGAVVPASRLEKSLGSGFGGRGRSNETFLSDTRSPLLDPKGLSPPLSFTGKGNWGRAQEDTYPLPGQVWSLRGPARPEPGFPEL